MKKMKNLMYAFFILFMLVGISSTALAATIPGSFNNWEKGSNTAIDDTYNVDLQANTEYEFKIEDWGRYNSFSQQITKDNCTNLEFNSGVSTNAKIKTDKAGKYTFKIVKWNGSNPVLSVTYPSSGGGSLKEPYVISVYIQDQWDEQYTFTPVPGSTNYEYEVSFEIPNYNPDADYRFWVGENNAWSNTYSENKKISDYVSDCSTGSFSAKIYALGENGQPHGSDYKNFGIHDFKCSESSAKLTLSSNVREFDKADPPTNITLTAQADEKTEGEYIWYKSDDEGATYTKLRETTESSYQLDYTPSNTRNYFKVERKKVDSNDMVSAITVIYTVQSCGENTKGSNIFREDFGELSALRGSGSRSRFSGIVNGYTYQEAPKKINDSYYAVVADPYYCGCGEGKDMNESVTDECLGRNAWFRELRDHTYNNKTTTGPYGGMLLLNFKEKGIAYERVLTDTEKQNITKNSILNFSAYFASAAKEDPKFIGIDMQLVIQFKKNGTSNWVDADKIKSTVKYAEGWQYAKVDWKVEDADGDFRVVIRNNTDSGYGNDLLVDDISLDLCTPAFTLYFKDENGNQTEDKVATNVSETSDIQVKKINFGSLGDDPCIQLYQVIKQGNNTSYKYISDFSLNGEYYQTSIEGTDVFKTIPEEVELVAIASIKENGTCNDAIKEKIENGEYTPGAQTNAIFSGNYLTYSVACGTSKLENNESVTEVCQTAGNEYAKMPVLKLSSKNSSNIVYFDIYHNNEILLDDVVYRESQTGYMLLDLDAMYEEATGESYNWPAGINTFKVQVKEHYIDDNALCTRWTEEVKINVVPRPVINVNLSNIIEVCEGATKELKIEATYVKKYQWQTRENPNSVWTNVGTNSDTYTTPDDIANGTQYRVLLYNDLDCATISEVATMDVAKCEDFQLTSKANVEKVCLGDEFIYTVSLFNNSTSKAEGVRVVLEWDDTELKLDESEVCHEFQIITKQWIAGIFPKGSSASVGLKFKVIKKNIDEQIKLRAYVSMINSDTYDSYDKQTDDKMKGETVITFKETAESPLEKRHGESYSLNICKGDKTYGEPIPFNFLIEDKNLEGENFDKSNLVWMDKDHNVLDESQLQFSVEKEDDVLLYVYNEPDGYCKSDEVEVRYRVKYITVAPVVKNYKECAIDGTPIPLSTLVGNADVYKYLIFKDKTGTEVTEFDPSEIGKTKYYITASQDEIESSSENYCEVQDSVFVTVKPYAKADNITMKDTLVCPGTELLLKAEANFKDENGNKIDESNVKINWYANDELERLAAYGFTYRYGVATKDTTVYLTIQSDNYCENLLDAKPININVKSATPDISLEKKKQTITIGATPSFTLLPQGVENDPNFALYVNDNKVDASITEFKPYVDSEYKVVYTGECGDSKDSALVYVQWPTVFTPHLVDGRNDTFVKDMDPNFKTRIFTRFGTKVYESDNGWDGSVEGALNGGSGKKAVPGVYYYVVELPDGNVKKGTIEVFKY